MACGREIHTDIEGPSSEMPSNSASTVASNGTALATASASSSSVVLRSVAIVDSHSSRASSVRNSPSASSTRTPAFRSADSIASGSTSASSDSERRSEVDPSPPWSKTPARPAAATNRGANEGVPGTT
ncbi:hypothetical protein D320_14046 [Haloferax sp. BAB-2207]|nr:hypothetical protein D320_14046 [Haloferax sp. BAB-2207]